MNLVELERIGTRQQVAPTMCGAHLADTTDPQHRALLIAAIDGKIYRGGDGREASVATLRACARKGYLRLTAFPGPRKQNWQFGELTNAGWAELKRLAK